MTHDNLIHKKSAFNINNVHNIPIPNYSTVKRSQKSQNSGQIDILYLCSFTFTTKMYKFYLCIYVILLK